MYVIPVMGTLLHIYAFIHISYILYSYLYSCFNIGYFYSIVHYFIFS